MIRPTAIVTLIALVLPQQVLLCREPAGGDEVYRLEVPARAGKGAGPLDWVYEKVDSARDDWSVERLSDSLKAPLDELAAWLVAGKVDAEGLAKLLAPGFRSGGLVPKTWKETAGGAGSWSSGRSSSPGSLKTVTPQQLGAELEELSALCGKVSKAAFKIFRVAEAKEKGGGLQVDTLLELDGMAGDGAYLQARTVWRMGWLGGPREGLLSLSRLDIEKVRSPGRAFSDVTLDCLGDDPVFRSQLSRGVGYWRTRIDASSGMDVYGHQGIAVGDFNNDGKLDFYVPQPAGLPNRLYRNLGNGRFSDAAAAAGVDVLDVTSGSLFVDLDNDGDSDLVAVTSTEILLFENDGRGRFRRVESSGLETAGRESASTLGCAAADYDLDGDLDLYVFSYVFWAGAGSKLQSTYPYPYHDANNGAPNFLFRNEGKLRFRELTASSGMGANNRRFSLAASWCDYDADGDPDLYVANDFGRNNLFRNEGGGKFRDVARELGVDDVGNGMSVTWEDVDNDGRMDLYVGNMWSSAGSRIAGQPRFEADRLREIYRKMSRGNSLFRNTGDGRFEDVSSRSGAFFGRWSWSGQFLDVEGDGLEDLYVVNGFISNESKDDL